MRTIKSTLIFFLIFVSFSIKAVGYETVYDPTACGHLIEEIAKMEQQISYMESELKRLDPSQYEWSDVQGVIDSLGSTAAKANSLTYTAKNLDSQFQELYPGYKATDNYSAQYENIVNTTLNTLNGILQSVGLSANDFEDENKRLQFLQS